MYYMFVDERERESLPGVGFPLGDGGGVGKGVGIGGAGVGKIGVAGPDGRIDVQQAQADAFD